MREAAPQKKRRERPLNGERAVAGARVGRWRKGLRLPPPRPVSTVQRIANVTQEGVAEVLRVARVHVCARARARVCVRVRVRVREGC
jgi:hypothetical protein